MVDLETVIKDAKRLIESGYKDKDLITIPKSIVIGLIESTEQLYAAVLELENKKEEKQ